MVQRPILKKLALLIIIFGNNCLASSSWVAEEGEYFFGGYYSTLTSIKNPQEDKYLELIAEEALWLNEIEEASNDHVNNDDIVNSRLSVYKEKIATIKYKKDQILNRTFAKSAINLYFEQGVTQNYSIGITGNNIKNLDFTGKNSSFENGELFIKKRIKDNSKTVAAIELGAAIEDYRNNHISPFYKINVAKVTFSKKKRKIIHEVIFANYFDSEINLSVEIRQTIELPNSFSFQLSNHSSYNKNYNPRYQYFSKDLVTVAKKIKSDILPFSEGLTISLGFYSDYYGKSRIPSGMGVICGFWVRL